MRGLREIIRLNRRIIYQQFKPGGDPRLSTLGKALSALGLQLHFSAAPKA